MTVTKSNYALKKNDLYNTEKWVIEALLDVMDDHPSTKKLQCGEGMVVWEPAAGNHRLAEVLVDRGYTVYTSDIHTYTKEHSFIFDFVSDESSGSVCNEAIVTNPPYGDKNKLAVKFCEKALERSCGMVAMLLTAKFDSGKTRQHLFKDNERFMGKVVLLDRISWEDNGKTGTEDHAWYIWAPSSNTELPEPFLRYVGKL